MLYSALVKTIGQAYDSLIVRAYIMIRFRIINTRILDTILNYFRPDRSLLVLGCGFGLFDLLVGLKWPGKRIVGVDINARRIDLAKAAAERLHLRNNTFEVQDLSNGELAFGEFEEILMLDLLHHVPADLHQPLLEACFQSLRPGGYLVIKDIHRRSPSKLLFTWVLDMVMTRGQPVFYREEGDLRRQLVEIGFDQVLTLQISDLLPYPHVQFVCLKAAAEG